jgi:hypothetical protein
MKKSHKTIPLKVQLHEISVLNKYANYKNQWQETFSYELELPGHQKKLHIGSVVGSSCLQVQKILITRTFYSSRRKNSDTVIKMVLCHTVHHRHSDNNFATQIFCQNNRKTGCSIILTHNFLYIENFVHV